MPLASQMVRYSLGNTELLDQSVGWVPLDILYLLRLYEGYRSLVYYHYENWFDWPRCFGFPIRESYSEKLFAPHNLSKSNQWPNLGEVSFKTIGLDRKQSDVIKIPKALYILNVQRLNPIFSHISQNLFFIDNPTGWLSDGFSNSPVP